MTQHTVTSRLASDAIPAEVIVRSPASASIGLPFGPTATDLRLTTRASHEMTAALEQGGQPSMRIRRVFWSYPAYKSPVREIRPSDTGIEVEQPLGTKLQALMAVRNGWDDGVGIAPQLPAILWVREFAREIGHQGVTALHVSPSHEGGLIVERQIGGARWSLEIDRDGELFLVIVTPDGPTQTAEPSSVTDAAEHFRRFLAAWGHARVTA
jgi:hypothetical protein